MVFIVIEYGKHQHRHVPYVKQSYFDTHNPVSSEQFILPYVQNTLHILCHLLRLFVSVRKPCEFVHQEDSTTDEKEGAEARKKTVLKHIVLCTSVYCTHSFGYPTIIQQ